jgi:hypothetical protein
MEHRRVPLVRRPNCQREHAHADEAEAASPRHDKRDS